MPTKVKPPPPIEWKVTIWTPKPYRAVTAYLSDEPPTPRGGGGGWVVVTLPHRPPVTVWRDPAPLVQTIGLRLGGGNVKDAADHVAKGIETLVEHFYRGDRESPPPIVRVAFAHNAVPYRGAIDWVISDLTWGPAQAGKAGRRIEQAFTVELTEFVADRRLHATKYGKSSPSKGRKNKKGKGKQKAPPAGRFIIVQKGETLATIARDIAPYGPLPLGWRTLGLAQRPPITDPRAVHVGQRLRWPKGFAVIEVVE